ncbi:gamma-glutamyltransferase [bacterium]|nr:gamma-glutamyltransferase [bacterium]
MRFFLIPLTCALIQPLVCAAPTHGFAATVHPLATRAALDALDHGGNAIDAAVAAALTLGVVDGHNSGIGGGCFFLVRLADGRTFCLDGRETAPAAASRDMYLRDGQPDGTLSKTGALASGVPGALAVYSTVLERFGKLPLADALRHGIRHAEQGFAIDEVYARKLEATAVDLAKFPATREIFLKPDGKPLLIGEKLTQKDLAESYRALAEHGAPWFYETAYPEKVETWMHANGGILTAADFKAFNIVEREPLISTYRGWTIVGTPPPSSGGVHIAQMLNILETFDPATRPPGSAAFAHTVTETMKLAFADRAHWLGDPAFTPVPRGLASKEYAKGLARLIDPARSTPVNTHGEPPDWQSNHFEKHTTHFTTADELGNWVSCTATINTAFGSKVVIPGTGILLNNEMDDFSIAPGTPNAFRLIGGEANSVAPGKRPLSCMSPTLVVKDGRVVLSVGAAGGPTIISQVLLGLVNCLDHGLSPADALAQARVHHQWQPDLLRIERGFSPTVRAELEKMGHQLETMERFGACQIIARDASGKFTGASDPRVPGLAAPTR